ncbi:MAG: hypothetical protein JXB32_12850 [Deltaproteobacteria bacterium]|nr:hypothetical protein [Deltaproteobacteria bacterium]
MLFLTAIGIGFLHTLFGPDHYVPFIVIGRARRWGLGRTSLLTFVCGLGHVLSSVLIGLVGLAAGAALQSVQGWEEARGEWAGWALFLLGLAYLAWGLWRGLQGHRHRHAHLHDDGTVHVHGHEHAHEGHPSVHAHAHGAGDDAAHDHGDGAVHAHGADHPHGTDHGHDAGAASDQPAAAGPRPWKSLTPWLLFLVFVLGPCEPLIPLFFASALAGAWHEVALVVLGYAAATLAAMHALVALFWLGLRRIDLGPLERWTHAAAGGVIALAGAAMVFLGL